VFDCPFWAVLDAGAAFDAGIDVGCGSLLLDKLKYDRRTHIHTDTGARAFVVVDFDSDLAISVLVLLDNHANRTPVRAGSTRGIPLRGFFLVFTICHEVEVGLPTGRWA